MAPGNPMFQAAGKMAEKEVKKEENMAKIGD